VSLSTSGPSGCCRPAPRSLRTRSYEIWYEATGSKVAGIGFAAVRDFVAFLRYERAARDGTPNPLIARAGADVETTGITHALGFGVSQSGRFLRHFLELGMNDDGSGRRVFDGVLTHVVGAGKVFANHSFAMPGRTATQHEDRLYPENWFPFGNAVTADPFSGRSGSLLKGRSTDLLMIEVNTSTEYWQKGASLVHTDPTGRQDAELPPSCRVYMIAGTQHGGGPGTDPSPGLALTLATRIAPARRCARCLWRLRSGSQRVWRRRQAGSRRSGQEPQSWPTPSTCRRCRVLPRPPGANRIAAPGRLGRSTVPKRQCRWHAGLCGRRRRQRDRRYPPAADRRSARHLHRLWSIYRAQPCELCDRDGSLIPFAPTRRDREAIGEPRLSLEERYGSREAYVAQVNAAAEAPVADRLLLPTHAVAYITAAEKSNRF
jgi:hypothetical protein